MLNDRVKAAKMVAEDLNELEAAIDHALICASRLTSTTVAARKQAKLAATVGQNATAKTGAAMAALFEARAQTIAAHEHFADVREQLGVTPKMTGEGWKINPQAVSDEQALLQSVA